MTDDSISDTSFDHMMETACIQTITILYKYFFFFKSTIYYMEHDGSLCLQEELCMEYQYPNLFYAVT